MFMGGLSYFSVDAYGVPANCLSLSDGFDGALGRVAAIGAFGRKVG